MTQCVIYVTVMYQRSTPYKSYQSIQPCKISTTVFTGVSYSTYTIVTEKLPHPFFQHSITFTPREDIIGYIPKYEYYPIVQNIIF